MTEESEDGSNKEKTRKRKLKSEFKDKVRGTRNEKREKRSRDVS